MPAPFSVQTIRDLAARHGTPCWVDDEPEIESRLNSLSAFDCVRLGVGNGDSEPLIRWIRGVHEGADPRAKLGVDVASQAATHAAIASGWIPSIRSAEILFSADSIGTSTLSRMIELGIALDAGSPEMISQIGDAWPGAEISITVNLGLGPPTERGIWRDQVDECLLRADQNAVMVTGLRIEGLGGDAANASVQIERIAEQIGRMLQTIIVPVGEMRGSGDFDGRAEFSPADFSILDQIRQRLGESFGRPLTLQADADAFLRRGTRQIIAEVRSVKKVDGRIVASIDLDTAVHPIGKNVTIVARTGDVSLRESMELTLIGRRASQRPDSSRRATLPIVRVGDLVTWKADRTDHLDPIATSALSSADQEYR